jgi:hypothetical protein
VFVRVVSKLEEEAKKRTSVEIDLDTGKPLTPQEGGSGYIPPEQNAPESAAPVPDTPDTDAAAEDTASAEADTAAIAGTAEENS